jgi:hypothetical protein
MDCRVKPGNDRMGLPQPANSQCGQLTLLRQFIDLYHGRFRACVQLAPVI